MGLWQAFEEVCAHLRAGLLDDIPSGTPQSRWEQIVEVSSLFAVLPALASCVKGRNDLSPELSSYFESVHWLNVRRNGAILDALAPTIKDLQAVGIDPILLKGVSLLVDGIYPDGVRFVGDADLLVGVEEAEHAYQTLLSHDYLPYRGSPPPEGHRHLPLLLHRSSGLAVEIHTRVEFSATDYVLPLPWLVGGCRTVPFRNLRVRVPDPTRLIGINFVHNPVNDYGRVSPIELRWLLDVAMIRKRYDHAIDWATLDHFVTEAGHATLFSTYLAFNETFFGQPAPVTNGRPDPEMFKELREHVDPWQRELPNGVDIVSHAFVARDAQRVGGHCWRIALPAHFLQGDTGQFDRTSCLEVFQDGRKLGPAFAALKVIADAGKGAYAHRGGELFFSTPDNADLDGSERHFVAKGWARSPAV